jgi:hypothetical protein
MSRPNWTFYHLPASLNSFGSTPIFQLQGLEASISDDLGHHFLGKLTILDPMTSLKLWEADISWYEGEIYAELTNEVVYEVSQVSIPQVLETWNRLENWFREANNWDELFANAVQRIQPETIQVSMTLGPVEELGEFAWDL